MTLTQAFRKGYELNVIDWHLRVETNALGTKFYIHPAGASGPTLDFYITEDREMCLGLGVPFERLIPLESNARAIPFDRGDVAKPEQH